MADPYRNSPADTAGESIGDDKLQRESEYLVLIIIKFKRLIGVYFFGRNRESHTGPAWVCQFFQTG